MGFYSVWPYFAGMAIILSVAGSPLLRWADTPPKSVQARVQTIDGLRGFLALGVVFHHAAIYHQYLQTGKWQLPPARFYADLGQLGVAMFFMVTGYLFWARMLKTQGKPDLWSLYVGRAFRIVPLYLALAFFVLLMVGILTNWHLREPPLMLARHVATWLAGGIFIGGDVNNQVGTGLISAYVTWSLHYEWLFYASLCVLSLFARKFILGTLLPVVGLMCTAAALHFHPNDIGMAAALMFFVGMTVASARTTLAAQPFGMPRWMLSVGVVGCLASVLLLFDGVYGTVPILITGVAFALVVFDATLFGILLTKPARRLGDISYGIYLLQGPVFFLVFAIPPVRTIAMASPWMHWMVVIISSLLLVMLATLTHALIERPGIRAGQWMLARIASTRRQPAVSTA